MLFSELDDVTGPVQLPVTFLICCWWFSNLVFLSYTVHWTLLVRH